MANASVVIPTVAAGQKKSAEWHETYSFSLVSRYRLKWSFRVFSMAWYSERAPKIKLRIRRDQRC